jgi:hypothetical protein
MATDYLKRINGGGDLYPPFRDKLLVLGTNCERRGSIYIVTGGNRTYEAQAKIYAIGRTTDADGKRITSSSPAYGRFRTKAPPGTSPHNFACAVDWCRDGDDDLSNGLQPDYKDEHYVVLAEEAKKLGLEAGFYWKFKDTPHVQLPIKARGLTWALLDAAYKKGGYPAVFKLLDQHGPW